MAFSATLGNRPYRVSIVLMRDVEEERRARACLEPTEIARLVDLAQRVERHYGRHQDIEWAIDRHFDDVMLLQSRPETVWSQKRAQQPTVAQSPLAAIAAAFLGGVKPKQ